MRVYSALGYEVIQVSILSCEERLLFILKKLEENEFVKLAVSPLGGQCK